jgi:hypothetical protein
LREDSATDAYVAVYNYSAADKYVIIVLDTGLEVYHVDGTECTVTDNTAGFAYLNCTTPRSEFAAAVIGSDILIANKTVTVAMDAATVAGSLTGSKQTFGTLPAATGSGNIYQVMGDNTNRFDNYYVKDDAATTTWIEWLKPGETYTLDEDTMPHKLTRTGQYAFTFDHATWTGRAVGDRAAIADPSIVGRTINDLFLYRNRLGFIADEFVVLSKAGAFYDLFPGTATTVLDDDPIDLTTSGQRKTTLRYAIPFNTALLLFSDQTQYQLTGGDTLTPRTCRVDPVTEFESDPNCRPVALGQEVYFAVNRTTNTAIRNYFIDTEALTNDASDVTAHVPSYIPPNVFKLAASTTEDLVFALTLENRNRIYLYKFYWQEDKKVQAAWQRFDLADDDVILGVEFINNVAYLVVQRDDGVFLETMDMQPSVIDDDLGFLCTLDRRFVDTGVYDSATEPRSPSPATSRRTTPTSAASTRCATGCPRSTSRTRADSPCSAVS